VLFTASTSAVCYSQPAHLLSAIYSQRICCLLFMVSTSAVCYSIHSQHNCCPQFTIRTPAVLHEYKSAINITNVSTAAVSKKKSRKTIIIVSIGCQQDSWERKNSWQHSNCQQTYLLVTSQTTALEGGTRDPATGTTAAEGGEVNNSYALCDWSIASGPCFRNQTLYNFNISLFPVLPLWFKFNRANLSPFRLFSLTQGTVSDVPSPLPCTIPSELHASSFV
jgi:hypothetical protein